MGHRSTFTTTDSRIEWPAWFIDKYKRTIGFPHNKGPIHPLLENKVYDAWDTLEIDIRSAIDWSRHPRPFILVYLHECGGISRCEISKDNILWTEPETWRLESGPTHPFYNCIGCSNATRLTEKP